MNQIEISHPLAQFRVGQSMMLVRRRLERFGEEHELIRENRQFAFLGMLQLPLDANDIAQVEALRDGPIRFADLLLADVELNSPRPILQVQKNQFSRVAEQHDAARGADARAMLLDVPRAGSPRRLAGG